MSRGDRRASYGRRAVRPSLVTPRRLVALGVVAAVVVVAAVAVQLVRAPDKPSNLSGAAPLTSPSSTTASPTAAATESAAALAARLRSACVAGVLLGMTPQTKAGQLLMIGAPVANPDSVAATVRRYDVGGVFLRDRSQRSAAAIRADVKTLQAAAIDRVGLQVAVDQEGGRVQTLQGADFPDIPDAVDQGELSAKTLRSRTQAWAARLADVGITIDLAPVADTVPPGTAASNPPIGKSGREYGSDEADVTAAVTTVVTALQAENVLATVKHFPGLGRVRVNTDTSTGAVDRRTTPEDPYLRPFAAAIEAGTAAVMISNASYPQLDADDVAAFSRPIITGLLRDRLGFDGLVVSDDLGAAQAVQDVSVGARATRFIDAGGDVTLTIQAEDAGPMSRAIVDAAGTSAAFRARVDDAVTHVLESKYRAGRLTCPHA